MSIRPTIGLLRVTIRLPITSRSIHKSSTVYKKARTSYNSGDSTIESDEILSENNPWSPTLYDDKVVIREGFRNVELPSNYRLSYQPLYESPAGKYVGMLKRLTISFAVLGAYGAKLFYDSPHFDDIYSGIIFGACLMPALGVQFKTRDYVTRIFRVYDKEKPQTLENLVQVEQLVMEKLNWSGGKTYNQLLKLTGNKNLKLIENKSSAVFSPYGTWSEKRDDGSRRNFYVADNVGGLRMDRIWGIVEKNSGVNNGRYIDDEV